MVNILVNRFDSGKFGLLSNGQYFDHDKSVMVKILTIKFRY